MLDFIEKFWTLLCQMAPYLLFGFLMGGIFSVFLSKKWLEKELGKSDFFSIFKASLIGVPMPLCSCSVLPVAFSMSRHGASPAAVVAFLVSTPQTGVDSIFANYAVLGLPFAIFRPIAALISGIISGIIVKSFSKVKDVEKQDCPQNCCSPKKSKNPIVQALRYGFLDLPKDMAIPFLSGTIVAAILTNILGPTSLSPYIGGGGFVTISFCILAGVPLYICATASLPLAASLIHLGASPGAAVAFLISGPATNASSLFPIGQIMGTKTMFLYLFTVIMSAFLGAYIFDFFFSITQVPVFEEHLHHLSYFEHLSALVLLILFAYVHTQKK